MAGRLDPSDLAKRILALDDGILGAAVLDKNGAVVGSAFTETFTKKFSVDAEFMTKAGAWGAIVMSISKQMDAKLSGTEAVVFIRKNLRLVLVPIESLGISIGVAIIRSADGMYITTKIRELFR